MRGGGGGKGKGNKDIATISFKECANPTLAEEPTVYATTKVAK